MFEYGKFDMKSVCGILKMKKATKFTERDHDDSQSRAAWRAMYTEFPIINMFMSWL